MVVPGSGADTDVSPVENRTDCMEWTAAESDRDGSHSLAPRPLGHPRTIDVSQGVASSGGGSLPGRGIIYQCFILMLR